MTGQPPIDVLNFREVAGFAGAGGGRLRRGVLFRCAAVETPEAAAGIQGFGVTVVCDLRSNTEQRRHPSALRALGLPHAETGHDIDLGAPVRLLRDAGATEADSRAAMIALYARLPQVFQPVLRRLIAAIVATDGAALVHCAAGKDRTGVAVALVLAALGVARDDIVADFLASNAASPALRHSLVRRYPGLRAADDPALGPVTRVEAAYLDSFFSAIGASEQDLAAYLGGPLGLDLAAQRRLQDRMLT